MRCEELEAIVFSGREISAEEREEMEAHAQTCEACRALLDHADVLSGMQHIDEDVTAGRKRKKRGADSLRLRLRRLRYLRSLSAGGRGRALRGQCSGAWRAQCGGKGRGERQHGGGREEDRPQRMADPENRAL